MTTLQVEYTEPELLADAHIAEPLIAGGVRCHGGFDDEGNYVSPRTKHRVPGIVAWQEKHIEEFDKPILDLPLETWPEHYPNNAQAVHLIKSGVPEPLIATLTRIGTVEGFGANIRFLQPGDMQNHFDESIKGTAIDHLGRGLFEAHGRDEAGWEKEAGHKDMWFAARDIAFENPTAKVDIEGMLQRMGFGQGAGGGGGRIIPERVLPDDIDPNLEAIAGLMTRVLLIEIQAFHTFKWAEQWLSDPTLVAGDGEAAKLVTYIRGDETPHVGYLKTGLTEMRDRTWIGTTGKKHSGEELFGRIWSRAIENSLGAGRDLNRKAAIGEVEHWCAQKENGADILAEFHALGNEAVSADQRVAAAGGTTEAYA
ncbi:MAG TPA: hypothetical protein VM143_00105 [Acidimicrobiales bacterium]|nr:hypothetical protein [Acidimicrobiales bacterium]